MQIIDFYTLSKQMLRTALKIGKNRFYSYPSQFITHNYPHTLAHVANAAEKTLLNSARNKQGSEGSTALIPQFAIGYDPWSI